LKPVYIVVVKNASPKFFDQLVKRFSFLFLSEVSTVQFNFGRLTAMKGKIVIGEGMRSVYCPLLTLACPLAGG